MIHPKLPRPSHQVIVTGAAGYIGRCTSALLAEQGYLPVGLDNYSTSKPIAQPTFPIHTVELTDLEATRSAMKKIGEATAIIHFAAKALVSESCAEPEMYFRNNVMATLNVAQVAAELGIPRLIHSSSCAVYGIPAEVPIDERSELAPVSPYGESKRLSEKILEHMARFRGLRIVNLRYFNPAGAWNQGRCGEAHEPETHLIPNVVRAFLENRPVLIYGDKFPTPDGTCVRDFIHIEDLAQAHVQTLRHLESPADSLFDAINLGGSQGVSVREVIRAAERVFGTRAEVHVLPPRPGDPPKLVAKTELARKTLGWAPRHSLEEMIASHATWERERTDRVPTLLSVSVTPAK